MEKRREKRIKKKLLVHISENGFEQIGVTANISPSGMFIATTKIFAPQSELLIWIAAADDIFALEGLVMWNMNKEALAVEGIPAGIGIKITKAAPGYAQYIASMIKNKSSKPGGIAAKKNHLDH